MKYHINPETGKVSPCRAKVKCRFGGQSGNENHFSDKQEAEKIAEKVLGSKFSLSGARKSSFSKNKDNIKRGLISAGIIQNASTLPDVNSKAEMIEKWFGGDSNKYELIARISDPNKPLKSNTRKSVGKFVSSGVDVALSKEKFDSAPSAINSDVELIDDNDFDISDIANGKIKAF